MNPNLQPSSAAPDSRSSAPHCLVVVPTYDEAESITGFLDALLAATATGCPGEVGVLVVDDSSPDGTGELVRRHPAFGQRLSLLSRPRKDGLAAAYRAGFDAALATGCDSVVQIDADGSHPVTAIPAMLQTLAHSDVVIGSRYVPGGATVGWSLSRRTLSRSANIYARAMLRLRTRDSTAGFRAWRSDALRRVDVLNTISDGYCFQIENTWRAEQAGLRVTELPIAFAERAAGASKMSAAVAVEALLRVAQWRSGDLAGSWVPARPHGAGARRHLLDAR